jgi:hypothetical protein
MNLIWKGAVMFGLFATRANSSLAQALRKSRRAFYGVAAISAILNILLLGGSIFMMMVYDKVFLTWRGLGSWLTSARRSIYHSRARFTTP